MILLAIIPFVLSTLFADDLGLGWSVRFFAFTFFDLYFGAQFCQALESQILEYFAVPNHFQEVQNINQFFVS